MTHRQFRTIPGYRTPCLQSAATNKSYEEATSAFRWMGTWYLRIVEPEEQSALLGCLDLNCRSLKYRGAERQLEGTLLQPLVPKQGQATWCLQSLSDSFFLLFEKSCLVTTSLQSQTRANWKNHCAWYLRPSPYSHAASCSPYVLLLSFQIGN